MDVIGQDGQIIGYRSLAEFFVRAVYHSFVKLFPQICNKIISYFLDIYIPCIIRQKITNQKSTGKKQDLPKFCIVSCHGCINGHLDDQGNGCLTDGCQQVDPQTDSKTQRRNFTILFHFSSSCTGEEIMEILRIFPSLDSFS